MSRILRHISAKDLKRTHQKKLSEQKELAVKKLKEWQEAEAERKQIEEAAKPYKSNWREEINLQESDWSAISGSGPTNSTSQSFQYGGEGGPIATFSGLGGVEAYPSTVNVDGETLNTPNYSQLAMQGYAKPLGGVQRQTQQTTQQTENQRIDTEIRKLEAQIKESKAKETAAIDAWNAELIATMDRHQREWDAVLKKDEVYNPEKHKGLQARQDAEIEAVWNKEPKTEPYEKERLNLRTKIAELEKQRPINQQLNVAQQVAQNANADVFMGARVQPAAGINVRNIVDDSVKRTMFLLNPGVAVTVDNLLDLIPAVEKTKGVEKGLESAINILNHHVKWQKNPTPEPQDLTNKLSSKDKKILQDVVDRHYRADRSDEAIQSGITNELPTAISRSPGLKNSLGTIDTEVGDGAYVVTDKKGDKFVEIRKAYDFNMQPIPILKDLIPGLPHVFPAIADFTGSGDFATQVAGVAYGASKLGPYASIFGTDTMNIVIRIPLKKEEEEEEEMKTESTTWSRLQKHR